MTPVGKLILVVLAVWVITFLYHFSRGGGHRMKKKAQCTKDWDEKKEQKSGQDR